MEDFQSVVESLRETVKPNECTCDCCRHSSQAATRLVAEALARMVMQLNEVQEQVARLFAELALAHDRRH